jgi:putative endopeptidase
MKKLSLAAASLLVLAWAAPAIAGNDHDCIDDMCTMVSLIEGAQMEQGGAAITRVDAPRMGEWGIDTAGMDKTAKPGDDFFAYVNGNWAQTTEIPSDRSSFGAFAALRDLSEARLRSLVEGYELTSQQPDQAKVAALYRTYMDEELAERTDAIPLLTRLAPIYRVQSKDDMARLMGASRGGWGSSFFGSGVSDDAKNPDRYTLYMGQSGLGLGDRELYLDAKFAPQKARYQQYVAQMLDMAGWPTPQKSAADIVALETRIAQAHWTRAESRNRDLTYNPMTMAELQAAAPGFPWATFWNAANLGTAERVIVSQSTAIPKIAQVFAEADLQTLKAWQAFHTTDQAAPLLSKRFVDAHFDFRARFLQGQPEQRERWKRGSRLPRTRWARRSAATTWSCTSARLQGQDGPAGGQPPDRDAAAHRGARLDGPGHEEGSARQARRLRPEDRLSRQLARLLGPRGRPGDLFGNAERARRFEWDFRRDRIGQPVDKASGRMTPQTVNAYYSR